MGLGFRARIFLASASNAGVQFMSSIMFVVAGPLFRDQYHLASSDVAIIMAVVIPFSGVITQVSPVACAAFRCAEGQKKPVVGAWSDRLRSRHGRRRPFILVGSIVCALGMLLFGFSNLLGLACGDNPDGTTVDKHVWGVVVSRESALAFFLSSHCGHSLAFSVSW